MRDLPMLETDREGMREEFGKEFDDMTVAEMREACNQRHNELLDIINIIKGKNYDRQ